MRREGVGELSAKEKSVPRRATAENARQTARRMGLHLHGAAREGAIILLLAGCVFLLLALFSYEPADPGWSHRGPETDVDNWMGPIGAWLSDVLYSLFGASALWWPGMLGFASWWLIRSRKVHIEWDATEVAVRLGGLVLLLLGTTTLGALHFYSPESKLPYGSGGILGEGMYGALEPHINPGGTGLLAVAVILIGFPLFTGLSWLTVMDELGHRGLQLWRWAATPFGLARERQIARGAERDEQADEEPFDESVADDGNMSSSIGRRGWRRLLPWGGVGVESTVGSAESREPSLTSGFGDDGATDIPWEVPERTPSAKRPEAAYTAREAAQANPAGVASVSPSKPSPGREAAAGAVAASSHSLSASRHDEPVSVAMPLRATEDKEPMADDDSVPNESREAHAEVTPSIGDPLSSKPELERAAAGTSRREPGLSDWQPENREEAERRHETKEPRLSWDSLVDGQDESGPVVPESEPEPERSGGYPDQAAGLRAWQQAAASSEGAAPPESLASEPDDVEPSVEPQGESRVATAEQARAAAAQPEGPTLWTVEHLQSQRPQFDELAEPDGELPSLRLLTPAEPHQQNYTEQQLTDMAELLETRLREYGVKAEVVNTWPGPVITRFEIKPAAGVKVSKISNLAKDLARSLMVKSVRVVEVIPGRPTVGIEIPNPHRAMIRLREVIDSDRYQQEASPLTMALGQDIGGAPVVANLGKMPHLLVAGTTGSGKSVGVNAMLISMLLKATPEELRLIMVDPKMLELSVYDGIPHLLAPVVTDMKEAANSLRWCVAEMERRYKLMAAMGVRNIAGFNGKLDEAERAGAQVADPLWDPQPWEMHEPPPVLEKLPYIVVVIDEFADMFMIVGKKVEELIARLAQKARAAGIHLILATQRPSVDVVTGLIKANIPTRMAFQVSSRVDSRTILDQGGAENLLGHGDMLYLPAGSGLPTRVHGAFVDDDEVHRIVEDWKRRGEPVYIEEILSGGVSAEALTGLEADGSEGGDAEQDALYDEAVQFVTESRRASISAVQRRFKIGYNRAARLVEAMEVAGVVSSMGTNGAREVLAPPPVGH